MSHAPDCIFCQIVSETPDQPHLLENEHFIVIPDLYPNAPTHLLLISKKPYTTLESALEKEPDFGAALLATASQAAHLSQIADNYRLVMNVGHDLQQIKHFHLHLLGGWPPENLPL